MVAPPALELREHARIPGVEVERLEGELETVLVDGLARLGTVEISVK